jgi:hypothetical protein
MAHKAQKEKAAATAEKEKAGEKEKAAAPKQAAEEAVAQQEEYPMRLEKLEVRR